MIAYVRNKQSQKSAMLTEIEGFTLRKETASRI